MPKQDAKKLAASVGRRVAELRHARGETQAALAERLNVSVKHLSRLEVGTNSTIATLAKLANALRVTVADLFVAPSAEAPPSRRGRPRKLR